MQYYMPVRLYTETEVVRNHTDELCAMGKRALIVTGRHSADLNGSFQDVSDALSAGNVSFVRFSEVGENPDVETVMKARDTGISEQVDFVIGIGGGSPMDAAKAIALMIANKEQDASFMYETDQGARLPLVLIPTTCGSGSEATGISVLSLHDTKTKLSIAHKIFADFALLDPRYIKTLPAHVLSQTGYDAFAHLAESYVNGFATPYSKMCVDAGLKLWRENKEIIAKVKQADTQDAVRLLTASAIAGMAIAQTGTSLPHGLSYSVTYLTGMAHGRACGAFLGGYLAEAEKEDRDHILQSAGFTSLDDLEAFYDKSCHREQIPADVIDYAVQDLMSNPKKRSRAPFETDEALLRRIASFA